MLTVQCFSYVIRYSPGLLSSFTIPIVGWVHVHVYLRTLLITSQDLCKLHTEPLYSPEQ